MVLPRRERAIRERARAAAGRVAISDKLGEQVGSLSHGEHRQVALAMALAAEPKALMLDEPASGLSRGERVSSSPSSCSASTGTSRSSSSSTTWTSRSPSPSG